MRDASASSTAGSCPKSSATPELFFDPTDVSAMAATLRSVADDPVPR